MACPAHVLIFSWWIHACHQIRNLVGDYVTIMIVCITLLGGGLGIALFYCWRTALVVLATMPFLVVGGVLMMKLAMSSSLESEKSGKSISDHATMVLGNVRLVNSMGMASHMLDVYGKLLDGPCKQTARFNFKVSAVAIFSEFSKFGAFALAFYYGSVVVDKSQCSFSEMFSSLNGVLFCGILGGVYLAQLPKVKDASAAAARIRQLLSTFEVSGDDVHICNTFLCCGYFPPFFSISSGNASRHFCF